MRLRCFFFLCVLARKPRTLVCVYVCVCVCVCAQLRTYVGCEFALIPFDERAISGQGRFVVDKVRSIIFFFFFFFEETACRYQDPFHHVYLFIRRSHESKDTQFFRSSKHHTRCIYDLCDFTRYHARYARKIDKARREGGLQRWYERP